jgi:F-type H+-transporting ATPase subunit gamma
MASLRDIRKRIRSVKNTQQITRAMKMVAAAKLRKAQDAILSARPYAQMLDQVISDLVARAESLSHPLLVARPVRKVELVVLTSDRGLAGAFNANVLRRASRFVFDNQQAYEKIEISTVGRKGLEFFRRRRMAVRKDFAGLFGRVSYAVAAETARELASHFLSGQTDAIFLVYNEFVSAVTQRLALVQLVPMEPLEKSAPAASGAGTPIDFKYEPSIEGVLEHLVPQALTIRFYRALLESVASEHGARMSAMEKATSNASDMIDRLTLFYNRTRQAVITKELMEIVSGAEALK